MQCWTINGQPFLSFSTSRGFSFYDQVCGFQNCQFFSPIFERSYRVWANIIPLDIVTLFNFPSEIYEKSHFCHKWSLCTIEVFFFGGGGGVGGRIRPNFSSFHTFSLTKSLTSRRFYSLNNVRLEFHYWGSTIDSKLSSVIQANLVYICSLKYRNQMASRFISDLLSHSRYFGRLSLLKV